MRRALALTLLLVVPFLPALQAAPIVLPPLDEALVEGHTVYSVLQARSSTSTWTPWQPAIASMVAAPATAASASHAGVRWFNDQDLVSAHQKSARGAAVAVLVEEHETRYVNGQPNEKVRWPCTGAVALTSDWYPGNPLDEFLSWDAPVYLTSFFVTDPSDREWTIDQWQGAGGIFWTVAILGRDQTMQVPDDGVANCRPAKDTASAAPQGDHGRAYPGRWGPLPFPLPIEGGLQYNALLYVPLDLLYASQWGARDHADGAHDRVADDTGCHAEACPGGDELREGNSHPYNWAPDLLSVRPSAHGGSMDCSGDGVVDHACHEVRAIRLHYGAAPVPVARHYGLFDTAGSTADW